MITSPILPNTLLAMTVAFLLSGCGQSEPLAHDHDHEGHSHAEPAGESHESTVAPAATFAEGTGVLLSPAGREAIGLQTEEVGRMAVKPAHTRQAQVYRHAREAASRQTRPGFAYASLVLPAEEARGLQAGQSVRLLGQLPASSGRLLRVDWQLEEITGQAEALVEIPDKDQALQVGQFVEADLVSAGQPADEYVTVPQEAVLTTAKGEFVFVQNGKHYLRTPIETAGNHEGRVLVADGVYEGDIVATAGAEQLYLIELQAVNAGQGCAHGH